jgi:hypothetical protein
VDSGGAQAFAAAWNSIQCTLFGRDEAVGLRDDLVKITVDTKPSRAGIDPYNKLIDRIADDNMIDVTDR